MGQRTTYVLKAAKAFTIGALLGASINAHSLTTEVQRLVTHETQFNAAGVRSPEPVQIYHYEIPLELLEKDIARRTPTDVLRALTFKKADGKTYVRWVINPEDTKWHLETEKWLQSKGLSTEKKTYFTGYMTASRSYIVEDPNTHAQFSIKVSTNVTGGSWRDKKQEWEDAKQVRIISDYVVNQTREVTPSNFITMDEPVGLGIKDIDQGLLIRLYNGLPDGKKFYVPGFSVLHDQLGKDIAARNGSNDPAAFWNENYNKPLARGLAELAAMTGISYDSPHSQNFMVELDAKTMKPTGRIVFRDFGDTYMVKEHYEATKSMDLYNQWEAENRHPGRIDASVGVLHGNQYPSWINDSIYDKWGEDFYKEYSKELRKVMGLSKADVDQGSAYRNNRYFMKNYKVASEGFQKYYATLSQGPAAVKALRCETTFGLRP